MYSLPYKSRSQLIVNKLLVIATTTRYGKWAPWQNWYLTGWTNNNNNNNNSFLSFCACHMCGWWLLNVGCYLGVAVWEKHLLAAGVNYFLIRRDALLTWLKAVEWQYEKHEEYFSILEVQLRNGIVWMHACMDNRQTLRQTDGFRELWEQTLMEINRVFDFAACAGNFNTLKCQILWKFNLRVSPSLSPPQYCHVYRFPWYRWDCDLVADM